MSFSLLSHLHCKCVRTMVISHQVFKLPSPSTHESTLISHILSYMLYIGSTPQTVFSYIVHACSVQHSCRETGALSSLLTMVFKEEMEHANDGTGTILTHTHIHCFVNQLLHYVCQKIASQHTLNIAHYQGVCTRGQRLKWIIRIKHLLCHIEIVMGKWWRPPVTLVKVKVESC